MNSAQKENTIPTEVVNRSKTNSLSEFETPQKQRQEEQIGSSSSTLPFMCSPAKRITELLEKAKNKQSYIGYTNEQFINIENLTLNYYCQSLQDTNVHKVFSTVFQLTEIKTLNLNLQINDLTHLNFDKITFNCEKLTSLKIDFGSNNFGQDNGLKSLECAFKALPNLKQLQIDLRWNNLVDKNCESIAKALKHLPQIEELSLLLGNNKISSEGIKHLCNEVKNLVNLKKYSLHVFSNLIDNQGAIHISQSLENMTNLHDIDINLQDNQVENQGSIELCKSISNLESLVNANILLYMNKVKDYGILQSTKQFISSKNFSKLNKFILEFILKYREQFPSRVYVECEDMIKQKRLSLKQHLSALTVYKKYVQPQLHFQPEYQHWDLLY